MKKLFPIMTLIICIVIISIIGSQNKGRKQNIREIAIATLMSHPALDAVQENLKKELARQGFIDGENIHYTIRNANGQIQLAAIIANELASQNLDVIVAIATPMAQAIAKVARCPVVFGAVTDPVGAGIVKDIDKGENMITGTSDAWPYGEQLKLIRRISPKAKRLGVLYNPGEAASQYGIKQIRNYAFIHGFELVEGTVSSTIEVYPIAQNLVGRVDALYLSSDNTVIGGVAAAAKVAIEHKVPLYVGDSGTVEKGGLAAVSVGYKKLGIETGKLVARFLNGERGIPTFIARDAEIYINIKAAELMGISIPNKVLQEATVIYETIK